MKCPDKDVWSQYREGQLSGEQNRLLHDHLKICPLCSDFAAQEDRFEQMLRRAAATDQFPEGWCERMQAKVQRRRRLHLFRSGILPLSIIVAALTLSEWAFWNEMEGVAGILPIFVGSGWWFQIPGLILSLLAHIADAALQGGAMLPSLFLLGLSLVVVQFTRMKGGFHHA